jgi:hypothetical protein
MSSGKGCLEGKRPAEAGRFSRLSRIAVARLVERLFGILVILDGSLTLLARFRATTALLLAGLPTGRLILRAWPILVRHGVSFPGNNSTTTRSQGSFRKRKSADLWWQAA